MSSNQSNQLNDSEKILLYVRSIKRYIKVNESLKNSNPEQFHQKLLEKYGAFKERFPSLFQMLLLDAEGFDERRLIQMLRLKERVSNNNISYQDASIQIGQQYFDEYVKPIVDNPNNSNNPNNPNNPNNSNPPKK
jgi:hypothetical protein